MIIHEANNSSALLLNQLTTTLLPNDANASLIREEHLKLHVDGNDNHSTSEEHESAISNNSLNNEVSDNQDNEEAVSEPSSLGGFVLYF